MRRPDPGQWYLVTLIALALLHWAMWEDTARSLQVQMTQTTQAMWDTILQQRTSLTLLQQETTALHERMRSLEPKSAPERNKWTSPRWGAQ